MCDNLPFEIRVEIMNRLPVKLLIQCRSVSKSWKNLIDSSDFIAHYHPQHQHLLVTYQGAAHHNPNYFSIADDQTFPHLQVSPTVPLLLNMLNHSILNVIGCSHGLLCLHGVYPKTPGDHSTSRNHIALLWNFSIRRAIAVVVPNVSYGMFLTVFGFGVSRVTTDPKIVKITQINRWSDRETISSIPWQVEVFALSTGVWRPPYSSNLPRESITLDIWWRVVADGFIYWLASDRISMDGGGYTCYHLIMSFDITTEEFRQVDLPHCLAHESRSNLSMSKLRESLVVFHDGVEADNPVIGVWMMEDGVSKLFTKLFTINVDIPNARINIPGTRATGFRKSGEPIVVIRQYEVPIFRLFVYDPNSKHFDYLGIDEDMCTYLVYPYMETLLLLDQPNVAAYNEMKTIRFLDDLASQGGSSGVHRSVEDIY